MTVNLELDAWTATLTELAQGTLAPDARRCLVQSALRDPQRMAELKLAMRLSASSAELSCDWVRTAAQTSAPQRSMWWRPLVGACASLAIVAVVISMPRPSPVDRPGESSLAHMQPSLPDRIGSGSFETPELFGGSFEAD